MAFIATRSGLTRWIDFVHDDPSRFVLYFFIRLKYLNPNWISQKVWIWNLILQRSVYEKQYSCDRRVVVQTCS